MKIPFYHGMTERIMMVGIPRKIAILGGTISFVLVLGLHSWWVIPAIIILYFILVFLYKKDPYFLEIMVEHIKSNDYLFP